jgi:hypothetical protein
MQTAAKMNITLELYLSDTDTFFEDCFMKEHIKLLG